MLLIDPFGIFIPMSIQKRQPAGGQRDDNFLKELDGSSPLFVRQVQEWCRNSDTSVNINDVYLRRLQYAQLPLPKPEIIRVNRILDAPGLEDDYYLNVLDWSPQNNHIALGLGASLYLWNASTEKSLVLTNLTGEDRISSVAWWDQYLAVGTRAGVVQMFDINHNPSRILTRSVHSARVSSLSWQGENRFTSSSRDRSLLHYDLRQPQLIRGRICHAHEQEICGLRWDPTGEQLASGGNDNLLQIWEGRQAEKVLFRATEHKAAVKALAWAPHRRGWLASGGGTADRTIRIWHTITNGLVGSAERTPNNEINSPTDQRREDGGGISLNSVKNVTANSQVCSLLWSLDGNSLASAHGFSEHLVLRWSYPDMTITGIMRGHERRVLYMAASPDGKTVVTGGADQTLRFWPVFSLGEGKRKPCSLTF